MSFRTLPPELQDIVWSFCGDLRDRFTRFHKFSMLELRVWNLITGVGYLTPSRLIGLRATGCGALKAYMSLAYRKAQLEASNKRPLKLEQLQSRTASRSPIRTQPLGSR